MGDGLELRKRVGGGKGTKDGVGMERKQWEMKVPLFLEDLLI